jgi:hypothetical protein
MREADLSAPAVSSAGAATQVTGSQRQPHKALACAFLLDAQITATLNPVPGGSTEINPTAIFHEVHAALYTGFDTKLRSCDLSALGVNPATSCRSS